MTEHATTPDTPDAPDAPDAAPEPEKPSRLRGRRGKGIVAGAAVVLMALSGGGGFLIGHATAGDGAPGGPPGQHGQVRPGPPPEGVLPQQPGQQPGQQPDGSGGGSGNSGDSTPS